MTGDRALRLPTIIDVREAAARLHGRIVRTPLLENAELNARAGARVFLKVETLQHTVSFKVRGAFNRLLQMRADERNRVSWPFHPAIMRRALHSRRGRCRCPQSS